MTTTTLPICASSCENQLWISSANLLARWGFNNNLLDDVTNSPTAAAQSPTYATGYTSDALLLDANANQTLTSATINITQTSSTFTAWIYPTAFPNTQEHSIVGLCPLTATYECLYLIVHETGGNHVLYFGFYGDDCEGNTIVNTNEWTHVAFVFDVASYTQTIYINGKLDGTKQAGSPFKANPGSVTIGNIPGIDSTVGANYFQVRFCISPVN